MGSCIVCDIVSGSIKAHVLYEDELIICFLDANPISEGHVLICPKKHLAGLSDLSDVLMARVFAFAQRMTSLFEHSLRADGVSLLQNNGAFNELGHFHLHVFARWRGDGFSWQRGSELLIPDQRFNEMQDYLRNALEA